MADICAAARGGSASFSASFLPFANFDVTFIGTGTAKFSSNIELNLLDAKDKVVMEWIDNVFIGHHWALGDFKIELNTDKKSVGRIENVMQIDNKYQALNINEFYFKFTFPRLNNLTILNDQPIINSSIVFDIPPTQESTYKLNEDSKSIKAKFANERGVNLKFNFCDISIYPEKNIQLDILSLRRIDVKTYKASVKYSNLTNRRVTCAYFLVLHDKKLITKNDYGFKKVNPNGNFIVDYIISHELDNVLIDIPIYGGIYLPKALRGSVQKTIQLQF